MKLRLKSVPGMLLLISIIIAGCNGTTVARAAETLNGAGASFPYPLYSAWGFEYAKKTGVQVNYQSIGSGGGVKQITSRTVEFGASDDALKPEQLEKDGLLQWPQALGGVVLAINVPGIRSEELTIDAETTCGIYMGTIRKWNDPKIKALNPKTKLPSENISVIHRADGSGTTAVFTYYLDNTCAEWHSKVGQGKSVSWPVGIGAKGNEGVSNYVKQQANSIGYIEYAYAKQNKLPYTLMKNAAGKVVKPSVESFADAAAKTDFDPKKHFYAWITNAKSPHAWPLAAATYILVAKEKKDANKRVARFFEYGFGNDADAMAKKLDYVPLPDSLVDKIRKYWKDNGMY